MLIGHVVRVITHPVRLFTQEQEIGPSLYYDVEYYVLVTTRALH